MPRAIGANSKLYMAVETAYGTPPGGDWRLLPFVSCTLGAEQPLLDADVIGVGTNRDPAAPFRDILTVAGPVVVPVDLNNIGHWLRLLLGPPTTTGTAPDYEHVFVSGEPELPSNSIEIAFPDVPNFDLISGVRADTFEIDVSPSGAATATVGLIAQGSTRGTTSVAGTPPAHPYLPFNKAQGSIKRKAAPLAQITGGRVAFTNAIEAVRTIRNDLKLEGADPGIARATGQVTSRFADTLLFDDAAGGAPIELEFGYTISASRSLTVVLHEAYLALARTPIEGPAGIEAAYEFRAAFNAAAGRMMTVTLRNAVESYA